MAIRQISEALTYEANSQYALQCFTVRDPELLVYLPVYALVHHQQQDGPICCCYLHRPLGVSIVTEKGEEGAWNCLVKVKMKQLSVQGALNNLSAKLCNKPNYT